MTIIRTTCATCGDVEVPAWAVDVSLVDAAEGILSFTCPICSATGRVDADAAAIALLSAAGVAIHRPNPEPPQLTEEDIERALMYLGEFDALCDHPCLLG